MYLKNNVDTAVFLNTIRDRCHGDVFCRTQEGDILNLRSVLCKYMFAVVANDPKIMKHCVISCEEPADYEILAPFLKEEESE